MPLLLRLSRQTGYRAVGEYDRAGLKVSKRLRATYNGIQNGHGCGSQFAAVGNRHRCTSRQEQWNNTVRFMVVPGRYFATTSWSARVFDDGWRTPSCQVQLITRNAGKHSGRSWRFSTCRELIWGRRIHDLFFNEKARGHYAITDSGVSPNVVQSAGRSAHLIRALSLK